MLNISHRAICLGIEKQDRYLRVKEGTSLCGGNSCGEAKLRLVEFWPRVSGTLCGRSVNVFPFSFICS